MSQSIKPSIIDKYNQAAINGYSFTGCLMAAGINRRIIRIFTEEGVTLFKPRLISKTFREQRIDEITQLFSKRFFNLTDANTSKPYFATYIETGDFDFLSDLIETEMIELTTYQTYVNKELIYNIFNSSDGANISGTLILYNMKTILGKYFSETKNSHPSLFPKTFGVFLLFLEQTYPYINSSKVPADYNKFRFPYFSPLGGGKPYLLFRNTAFEIGKIACGDESLPEVTFKKFIKTKKSDWVDDEELEFLSTNSFPCPLEDSAYLEYFLLLPFIISILNKEELNLKNFLYNYHTTLKILKWNLKRHTLALIKSNPNAKLYLQKFLNDTCLCIKETKARFNAI